MDSTLKRGLDAIKGLNNCHLLPFTIINDLNTKGLDTLPKIWEWSWLRVDAHSWPHAWQIGLSEELLVEWERYRSMLFIAGINISQRADVLVWGGHHGNDRILVKEAYEHITSTSQILSFSDITSMFWKWDAPLKIKCFSWLVIHNRILTWDNLLRRGFFGPEWYCMFRQLFEDCLHLFIRCPFAVEIWARVATILGVPQINDAPSILKCFRLWNFRAKAHRTLPFYVLWGI